MLLAIHIYETTTYFPHSACLSVQYNNGPGQYLTLLDVRSFPREVENGIGLGYRLATDAEWAHDGYVECQRYRLTRIVSSSCATVATIERPFYNQYVFHTHGLWENSVNKIWAE